MQYTDVDTRALEVAAQNTNGQIENLTQMYQAMAGDIAREIDAHWEGVARDTFMKDYRNFLENYRVFLDYCGEIQDALERIAKLYDNCEDNALTLARTV